MSKIYYWEKLTFSKLVGKVNYLERKFEEMHYRWRAIRYKVYSGERLYRHYCLQLSFVYKTVSQISFNLFCLGNKRLLKFLREIMNVSRNILAKNQNFKKLRHDFVDERALITTTLTSYCQWETLLPLCLQKKIPENAFLTVIVNYRKIVHKKNYIQNKKFAI